MTSGTHIHSLDILIGKTVLARATANKLGRIRDLILDPVKGELAGLCVQMADESLRLIDYREVQSFGPDAVMVSGDESAIPVQGSPLKALPLARSHLIGVTVVTEGGKLLGQIANVYIHLAETCLFIYEVRASLLDKLLGHTLYFPASWGRAFSADDMRLVVSNETVEKADHSLDALAAHLFGPPGPEVVIRTRAH
jgi:uncharacterized protein YrrD